MIAVLATTRYVGSNLACVMASRDHEPRALFGAGRAPWELTSVSTKSHDACALWAFKEFALVVNAIGAGAATRVAEFAGEILDKTPTWDEHMLSRISGRDAVLVAARHTGRANLHRCRQRALSRGGFSLRTSPVPSLATSSLLLAGSMMGDYAGAPELAADIDCWRPTGTPNVTVDVHI